MKSCLMTQDHAQINSESLVTALQLVTEWESWPEAELMEPITYCRGSCRLRIPAELRSFDAYAMFKLAFS